MKGFTADWKGPMCTGYPDRMWLSVCVFATSAVASEEMILCGLTGLRSLVLIYLLTSTHKYMALPTARHNGSITIKNEEETKGIQPRGHLMAHFISKQVPGENTNNLK